MPLKMKQLPISERPYEKLKLYGPEKLSNAELLAIIIKSGTKDENSIDIANRILLLTPKIEDLKFLSIGELTKIKGIGEVKAIQIKAMCELTTRISKSNNKKIKLSKTSDVANLFMNEMMLKKEEHLKEIILNTKNEIMQIIDLSKGGTRNASISIKQILAEPIKNEQPKIILLHNHPSGDPEPSEQDYELTKSVEKASELFGIQLLDHIVIGKNNYKSILSQEKYQQMNSK